MSTQAAPFVPPNINEILAGAGLGLAAPGALPQNSSQSTQNGGTSSSKQDSTSLSTNQSFLNALAQAFTGSQGTTTNTTTPNLTPGLQQLMAQLTGQFSRIAQPDTSKIESGGIQNINRNSALQQEKVNADMASRGLSTSPVAATAANSVDNNRFSQINQFQQALPGIIQGLNIQGGQAAQNFLTSAPVGSTTTGQQQQQTTSNSQNSQNTQGNNTNNSSTANNSAFNSFSNTQGQVGGGASGAAGGLAAFLASLFG